MTGEAKDWVPLEGLSAPELAGALEEALRGWSTAWFWRRAVHVGAPRVVAAPSERGGADWRALCADVWLDESRSPRERFTGWALDAEPRELSLNAADRRILDELGKTISDDLGRRLALAFDAAEASVGAPILPLGGLAFALEDDRGTPVGVIALSASLIARFLRRGRREATARPVNPLALVGDRKVRLQATLGAAQLSLADLREVAVGDVLVLDTALLGAATLRLEGRSEVVLRARLSYDGDNCRLTIA